MCGQVPFLGLGSSGGQSTADLSEHQEEGSCLSQDSYDGALGSPGDQNQWEIQVCMEMRGREIDRERKEEKREKGKRGEREMGDLQVVLGAHTGPKLPWVVRVPS